MRVWCGLPFNACVNARACTSGRLVLGKPAHLNPNHGLHQGVAPPGLTYLTYRWRVKQGEEKNEAQAKNVAMHLCVCLITLILPLIICNLSNLALYRLLALLQDSFTETRDEKSVCCIRNEHTCSLYLIH